MEKIKEILDKYKLYLVGGLILIVIFILLVYIFLLSDNNIKKIDKEEDIIVVEEDKKDEESVVIKYLKVDIKGEVNNPGVYQLEDGSIVKDVIDVAKGLTRDADTSVINLSKKIKDEMVIIIYSKYQVYNFTKVKEEESKKIENCKSNDISVINDACIDNSYSNVDTPVNNTISINTGTKEELMTLTGIGESKANSIIEYRSTKGLFKSIEDIKNVTGIGDSLFAKIKDSITI